MSRRPRAVLLSAVFGRENFSVCAAQGGLATRGARRRFDVVPRESALSSGHTGRSRSCDDSHDSESCRWRRRRRGGEDGRRKGRKEEEDEQRAKFVRRIECAFIWRACMRTYVAEERRGEERSGARGDHQTHGMRASGEIGDYVRGSI